jgi:hypothetical protein
MLYVIAFWPKVEQVVGQNRSKLSLDVDSNQRSIALKRAFATSGGQAIIMLIVWVLFRSHVIGGILLLACVIADFLLWHRFHSHNYDANRGSQKNNTKGRLAEPEKVKEQSSDGSCGSVFAVLLRHRFAIVLILMSLITARVIAMCMMHGRPSFCSRCILYWGEHHSSYSGHYAEHSLFSFSLSEVTPLPAYSARAKISCIYFNTFVAICQERIANLALSAFNFVQLTNCVKRTGRFCALSKRLFWTPNTNC